MPTAQPPQGFGQPGFGGNRGRRWRAARDQLSLAERQDFGVAPSAQLHAGQMHGPTPASIPGGQVITTQGLVELMRGGQAPFLVLDVLGGTERIQGAQYAVPAAQAGSFNDATQQQFGQFLAASDQRQQAIPARSLLPVDAMLDVLQRGVASDQPRLHQRAVVSRRHRGMEAGRHAGAKRPIGSTRTE